MRKLNEAALYVTAVLLLVGLLAAAWFPTDPGLKSTRNRGGGEALSPASWRRE